MSTVRYVFNEIQQHHDDRRWWRDRIHERIVHPTHASVYPTYNGSISVMDQDWDTLIVLDACRADLFQQVIDLNRFDHYSTVVSNASATMEWAEKNFVGESFGDTVYTTANPFISKLAGDVFHDLIEVWKTDFDENEQTVRPNPVVKAALKAHEDYPKKRHIVHFMQPHYPFLESDLTFMGWHPDGIEGSRERTDIHTPWDALRAGLVEEEDIRAAYARNLSICYERVTELLSEISGKIVVTSDHGNGFGSRAWPIPLRIYGHPRGIRMPGLTRVPWAEMTHGSRRSVISEATGQTSELNQAEVKQRLSVLGYCD